VNKKIAESFSSSIMKFSTPRSETSGEKRATNKTLVLGLLETTGKSVELGVLNFLRALLHSLDFTAIKSPSFSWAMTPSSAQLPGAEVT
jgi:hypothetical protein